MNYNLNANNLNRKLENTNRNYNLRIKLLKNPKSTTLNNNNTYQDFRHSKSILKI